MEQKYIFIQDNDCHWYMLPVELKDKFNELNNMDTESDEWYKKWQDADFDSYQTGGGISNIEFIPVKK